MFPVFSPVLSAHLQGRPGSGTAAAFQGQGDNSHETSFSRYLADPFFSVRARCSGRQGLLFCLRLHFSCSHTAVLLCKDRCIRLV